MILKSAASKTVLVGGVALIATTNLLACVPVTEDDFSASQPQPTQSVKSATLAPSGQPTPSVQSTSTPATPKVAADPYLRGTSRARSAESISRSAQAQEDWKLIVILWRQAISYMERVPPTHPRYANAQANLGGYQHQLARAEAKAQVQTRDALPQTSTVTIGDDSEFKLEPTPTDSPEGDLFQAKIKRRDGGTPIIDVTFNDGYQFEMIVDTGASGTLITQEMADILEVTPVYQAKVDTASDTGVLIPVGYVDSIEVNGAIAEKVLVAIAKPQLEVGLLGHDFLSKYDVTVRQDVVEFRSRR
jgi:predicted aspartyl protease